MSGHDALDDDHGGLLSEATLAALNLSHQPFTAHLSDSSMLLEQNTDATVTPFSDVVTQEQLADIKQALITGDDLLLILGEPGSGKTTLLKQLDEQSGLRIQCFSVNGNERFSTLNLFAGMLDAFKREPPDKLKDILDELIPCLQTMIGKNTLCAVVLDDAHRVNQSELTQLLSGMLYVNSQDETLMRIALSADIEFEESIPDLLPEGADLPYSSLTIEGFTPARAAAYLDYRLQLAGFDQEFPFTERDMASLVDHSGGNPRELHALTADVLNEKHGRLDDNLPSELAVVEEGAGFLQTRNGKLALGAVATALIIGGLLLFLPPAERESSVDVASSNTSSQQVDAQQRLTVAEQTSVADGSQQTVSVSEEAIALTDSPAAIPGATGADIDRAESTAAATESTSTATGITNEPESLVDTLAEQADARVSDATEQAGISSDTTGQDASDSMAASDDQPGIDEPAAPDLQGSDNTEQIVDEPSQLATVDPTTSSSEQPAQDDLPTSDPTDAIVDGGVSATAQEISTDTSDSQPGETDALAESSPESDLAPDLAELLESPTWILVQDESQYTVQMSASRDLASVQNFIRRTPLPPPNSIFSFERDGAVWYALVHGIFPSLTEARQAVEQMSEDAQRDQPWIRSIARIKAVLREE